MDIKNLLINYHVGKLELKTMPVSEITKLIKRLDQQIALQGLCRNKTAIPQIDRMIYLKDMLTTELKGR